MKTTKQEREMFLEFLKNPPKGHTNLSITQDRAIVLLEDIDELEAHIHWQKMMIEKLEKQNEIYKEVLIIISKIEEDSPINIPTMVKEALKQAEQE